MRRRVSLKPEELKQLVSADELFNPFRINVDRFDSSPRINIYFCNKFALYFQHWPVSIAYEVLDYKRNQSVMYV